MSISAGQIMPSLETGNNKYAYTVMCAGMNR